MRANRQPLSNELLADAAPPECPKYGALAEADAIASTNYPHRTEGNMAYDLALLLREELSKTPLYEAL